MLMYVAALLLVLGSVHSSPVVPTTAKPEGSQTLESVELSHHNGSLTEEELGFPLNKIGSLEINFSEIKNISKHTLQSLENLENLTISYTHMERQGDDIFQNCCPKLKYLEIHHWLEFNENDLKGIGSLPLEHLEILDQKIPVLKSGLLKGTKLKSLGLTRNEMEKIEDGAFEGLDKLEYLLISNNKIKAIPKNALAPLKSLQTLELVSTGIEKISTDDFPELPNLTDLNVIRDDLKEINLEGVHKVVPKFKNVFLVGGKDVHVFKTDSQITIHNWA